MEAPIGNLQAAKSQEKLPRRLVSFQMRMEASIGNFKLTIADGTFQTEMGASVVNRKLPETA
jgi:hypothetical protein